MHQEWEALTSDVASVPGTSVKVSPRTETWKASPLSLSFSRVLKNSSGSLSCSLQPSTREEEKNTERNAQMFFKWKVSIFNKTGTIQKKKIIIKHYSVTLSPSIALRPVEIFFLSSVWHAAFFSQREGKTSQEDGQTVALGCKLAHLRISHSQGIPNKYIRELTINAQYMGSISSRESSSTEWLTLMIRSLFLMICFFSLSNAIRL